MFGQQFRWRQNQGLESKVEIQAQILRGHGDKKKAQVAGFKEVEGGRLNPSNQPSVSATENTGQPDDSNTNAMDFCAATQQTVAATSTND